MLKMTAGAIGTLRARPTEQRRERAVRVGHTLAHDAVLPDARPRFEVVLAAFHRLSGVRQHVYRWSRLT